MSNTPFEVILSGDELELVQNYEIKFTKQKRARVYSYTKAGLSIARKTVREEKPLTGSEQEILEKIHEMRFHKNNPYVITGGHFHQLYVRNLGIFYNALADSRIVLSEVDWIQRQSIILKTVALDLAIFDLAKNDFTTIIPLRNQYYTCLNMYAKPSDSLYSILYSLVVLTDETYISNLFPMPHASTLNLQAKKAGLKLIDTYTKTLQFLLHQFFESIIDRKTGLVRKDILLSSARDGIQRESSFYDNVIAWATMKLADQLNLYTVTDKKLEKLRENIIQTFWNSDEGLFIDDLSEESLNTRTFSADSFIVTSTGFLNSTVSKDRNYLRGMIKYVKRNKLDLPFPLHYAKQDSPKKLYRPVKYFAKSYMGRSIWSHWGIEYIKALLLMGNENPAYIIDASKHLDQYSENIRKYGGYPELYKPDGTIFASRFYKSVLHNGWVVNYEQAQKMIYYSSCLSSL